MARPRHHHNYVVSQFRHRSWFTRVCLQCGTVTLTWPARLLFGAAALVALAERLA